ncbi:hypothetical protein FXO37_29215 [Capsicum annuum]|nr:hypothetical protein FXO37_29215 [Capsicum annuum]
MVDNTPMKIVTRSISHSNPDAHTVPTFDLGISQSEEEDALPSKEVRGIGHKRKVRDDVSTPDNDDDDFVKEGGYKTLKCKVFELDVIKGELKEEIKNLGESAIFVGRNRASSVDTSMFTVVKPNHIYFADDWCFMSLELEESSKDALVIYVNGSTLRFSLREFIIITGLNCVANEDAFVIENKEPNWIVSREKHCIFVPKIHFYLVENGKYKDYPWGKKAFKDLVKSISKKIDAQKQYYKIHGMSLAMQVWLYECCYAIDPKIDVKHGRRILRLLNWETTDRCPHFEAFIEGMLADVDNPDPNVEAAADIPTVPQSSPQDINTARFSVLN